MDYQRIYDALIKRALYREYSYEPTEQHHIMPRCLGGTDHSDNIVRLTIREHFLAHMLLYKIHKLDYPNLIFSCIPFFFDPKRKYSLKGKKCYPRWIRKAAAVRNAELEREIRKLCKLTK